MPASFLLALREGVEAALIVGLVLSALRRLGRRDAVAAVWAGVAGGVAASAVVAWALHALGWSLAGRAEALFEGAINLTAAALLTTMIFWLQRTARRLRAVVEADVRDALVSGRGAVCAVAFVAVAREGVELAIFLGAASFGADASRTLIGASAGLGVAAVAGWALFATTARVGLRRFFQLSNALLLLFAAGLAAKGIGELSEAGWVPPLIDPLWNSAGWLPETALPGAMLKALLGYTSTPSLAQVIVYLVCLAGLAVSLNRTEKRMDDERPVVGPALRGSASEPEPAARSVNRRTAVVAGERPDGS